MLETINSSMCLARWNLLCKPWNRVFSCCVCSKISYQYVMREGLRSHPGLLGKHVPFLILWWHLHTEWPWNFRWLSWVITRECMWQCGDTAPPISKIWVLLMACVIFKKNESWFIVSDSTLIQKFLTSLLRFWISLIRVSRNCKFYL